MSKYILSTMTANVGYALYDHIGDMPILRRKIRIFGGAGLPSLKSGYGEMTRDHEGKPLWTANGMVTTVSDEDAEVLQKHPVFIKHLESGYVKFISGDITGNLRQMDKATATMQRDGFQLLTKDTLNSRVKVRVGNQADDENRI